MRTRGPDSRKESERTTSLFRIATVSRPMTDPNEAYASGCANGCEMLARQPVCRCPQDHSERPAILHATRLTNFAKGTADPSTATRDQARPRVAVSRGRPADLAGRPGAAAPAGRVADSRTAPGRDFTSSSPCRAAVLRAAGRGGPSDLLGCDAPVMTWSVVQAAIEGAARQAPRPGVPQALSGPRHRPRRPGRPRPPRRALRTALGRRWP